MELTKIHEHTVDLSLLPEKALILDIGCSGWFFTNYFRDLGHEVFAVDIQEFDGDYDRIAITGHNGDAYIEKMDDPQATRITDSLGNKTNAIACCTLETYSKIKGVKMWDLVKLDCEGSEYDIIMSLTKPPAKQLSIEFHLHTGIYTEDKVKEIDQKLSQLGYANVYKDYSDKHCAGFNIWDSLWVMV